MLGVVVTNVCLTYSNIQCAPMVISFLFLYVQLDNFFVEYIWLLEIIIFIEFVSRCVIDVPVACFGFSFMFTYFIYELVVMKGGVSGMYNRDIE